MAKSLKAEI